MNKIFTALLMILGPVFLLAQADTTDIRYKIGYEIGSWLPFVILAALFIFMLVKARQRSEEKKSFFD